MSFGWTGKPDRFISNIYEANKRWKYGKLAEDHEFFEKLGSGHAPKYLWIGMSKKMLSIEHNLLSEPHWRHSPRVFFYRLRRRSRPRQ